MELIKPNWPAPQNVHAYTTTRIGGNSTGIYDSLNVAAHTGDDRAIIDTNRALLRKTLDLPNEPLWLDQIHSTTIISADTSPNTLKADGSFAKIANNVCVVLTADCLPVLLTNTDGTAVAAVHAGWRGLAGGIIESAVKILKRDSSSLLAWMGPAISADHYEVGDEVRDVFVAHDANAANAYRPSENKDKWFMDLNLLAQQRLQSEGVTAIFGGTHCTFSDEKRFYSARRNGIATGRLASLIWLSPVPSRA